MSGDESTGRRRRHRGRPQPASEGAAARRASPTQARLLAVRVLDRVQRTRAWADLSLHHHLTHSGLAVADRGLATELVYGTLRWRGRIDWLLDHMLDQKIDTLEPVVASALRIGAYQILFSDRIPESAAVDEAVRCVRALGVERATGLVNAVLRRFAREHAGIALPDLATDPLGHLMHALSLPEWIAARWLNDYGPEGAAALAAASNAPPPLTVRTNTCKLSREELLADLLPRFPEAKPCRHALFGITLGRRGDPQRDPGFLAGQFTVQDEAAQLVVALLDPQPGDLVLDACAAPGAKTTGIAERLAGRGGVLALDRHPRRLHLVARATRRLGLSGVHTLERDASRSLSDLPTEWQDTLEGVRARPAGGVLFDRVLVDAPCTGLGTLRRNPDARWRVAASAPQELARIQLSILAQGALVLRPGGRLVYSTCTLTREENEDVVQAFLHDHAEFRIAGRTSGSSGSPETVALPREVAGVIGEDGFLRCLPHVHDMDGFFAAAFTRIG